MIQIKKDCLDLHVSCPATGKTIWLRELDQQQYNFFSKSYEWAFEEVPMIDLIFKKDDIEKKKSK